MCGMPSVVRVTVTSYLPVVPPPAAAGVLPVGVEVPQPATRMPARAMPSLRMLVSSSGGNYSAGDRFTTGVLSARHLLFSVREREGIGEGAMNCTPYALLRRFVLPACI